MPSETVVRPTYRYELIRAGDGPLDEPCRMSRPSRRALLIAARKEIRRGDLFGRWRVVRVELDGGDEQARSLAGWFDGDGIFRVYLTPRQIARRERAKRQAEGEARRTRRLAA